MAKGVHSKRRKRNQSIKRAILYESKKFFKIEHNNKNLMIINNNKTNKNKRK